MNCLKDIALFVLLLRLPQQVISYIELQFRRSYLETFYCEINLLPAVKTLLHIHLESLRILPLIVILRVLLNVDVYLAFSIQILKTCCKRNSFFVQLNLFLNTKVSKSLFEVRINHELIPLGPTKIEQTERLKVIPNFMFHEHY